MNKIIRAALIAAIISISALSCVFADTVPATVIYGKNESSAYWDGRHIYAPVSIASTFGIPYSTSSESGKVSIVDSEGAAKDIRTSIINGVKMLPVDILVNLSGGEAKFDPEKNTLLVYSHLKSVEFDKDTLNINFSFYVSYTTRLIGDKLIVDIPGARLAVPAKEVFVGSDLVQKVRLGQYNQDDARVVVDLNTKTGFSYLSKQNTAKIFIKLGKNLPQTEKIDATLAVNPISISAPPQKLIINEIIAEAVDKTKGNLIINTTGKGSASSTFDFDDMKLKIKIPGATLAEDYKMPKSSISFIKSIKPTQSKNAVTIELLLNKALKADIKSDDKSIRIALKPLDKSDGSISDKIIVIDPGHGGKDTGARYKDIHEADINLALASELAEILSERGVKVIQTRTDNTYIPLASRSQVAIDNEADMFISIHCNSNKSENSVTGVSTYYHMQEISSKALAYSVNHGVCKTSGMCDIGPRSDRSLYTTGFAVLRNLQGSGIPCALLECGFLNHINDRTIQLDKNARKKIVEGIALGISNYLSGEIKPK